LNEFEGTVMLVSHDRALLRSVCDEFWLVGRGAVDSFDGDLDDYQRYLLEESKRLREQARAAGDATVAATTAPPQRDAREQRRLDAQARQQLAEKTRPLKRELEKIDQRLAALGQEKTQLEERLLQALPAAEIADCGRRLKTCSDELETLEEKWLDVSTALEDLSR
ncbi:MAG TPA: ABC transporter, partial [Alicycliphilus sp.]|nr:ABC transporter [Alicycliphilus sp.]